jgi:hypothetical protein
VLIDSDYLYTNLEIKVQLFILISDGNSKYLLFPFFDPSFTIVFVLSSCWFCFGIRSKHSELYCKKQFIVMYCSKILEHTKSGSQYFSYIVVVSFIGGGKRSTRKKNHRPVAGHWQTLSHYLKVLDDPIDIIIQVNIYKN